MRCRLAQGCKLLHSRTRRAATAQHHEGTSRYAATTGPLESTRRESRPLPKPMGRRFALEKLTPSLRR